MQISSYFKRLFTPETKDKEPEKAYDLWADSYDEQPGNLMLDLDKMVLYDLLDDVDLTGKKIADIGCGTGRHWEKLLSYNPALLMGFDVSEGMLKKLKIKFPDAVVKKTTSNLYPDIEDGFFDVIVSTLTIAHMQNIEEVFTEWNRLLKPCGDIVLTDYHPEALAKGGKRTFPYKHHSISIQNYVHPVAFIRQVAAVNDLRIAHFRHIKISDVHRHYYEQKNAMHVFEKFFNTPIIYGMHLKKIDAVA